MEQVGWTDRNNNGRIELSELADSLRKACELLDTNQDGLLTTAEASCLQPEFLKMFDPDQNGKLSSAEFAAGYRDARLSL